MAKAVLAPEDINLNSDQISQKYGIPISTAHYMLQDLRNQAKGITLQRSVKYGPQAEPVDIESIPMPQRRFMGLFFSFAEAVADATGVTDGTTIIDSFRRHRADILRSPCRRVDNKIGWRFA